MLNIGQLLTYEPMGKSKCSGTGLVLDFGQDKIVFKMLTDVLL
jgi:hypothetical protein